MSSPLASGKQQPFLHSSDSHPKICSPLILVVAVFMMAVLVSQPSLGVTEVPVLKAGMGPCTADFTVTNSTKKPIYDAKIHIAIAYGFMSKRKQDLEIGTNSDGKARFEGLPDKLKKKPVEFQVRSDQETKSVPYDPQVDCHPKFNVIVGAQ